MLCILTGAAVPMAGSEGLVRVHDPAAQVRWEGDAARLLFTAEISNDASFAIEGIHLGLLFGEPAKLERLAAHQQYRWQLGSSGTWGGHDIGVVQQQVAMVVPAGGRASISFDTPLPNPSPALGAFRVHVLGYEPSHLDLEQAFGLLDSGLAADEMAVVQFAGLLGEDDAKLRARQRCQKSDILTAALAWLNSEQAADPQGDGRRMVFVVRQLGVCGGIRAADALKALLQRPWQAFAGPFQALRVARVAGSPWAAPLAHSLPADLQDMRALIALAREESQSLDKLVLQEESRSSQPAPPLQNASQEVPQRHALPTWILAGLGLIAGLGVLLWRFGRKE